MPALIIVNQLVYVVGQRCECARPGCIYRNYQASIFLTCYRVLMGRN